jgi:hypothetical protein
MATIAVFVALGGTGYAAAKLPRNSVGSAQIKKNAVSSSKVKNGSLLKDDFKVGQLPAGATGPAGPAGPKGADGQNGTNGTNGTNGAPGTVGATTVQFTQAAADLANGAETSIDAQCPDGQQGIAGGVRGDLTNSELTKVTASRPIISSGNSGAPDDDGTFTGWRGTFVATAAGAGIRPEVWVVCADAPTP